MLSKITTLILGTSKTIGASAGVSFPAAASTRAGGRFYSDIHGRQGQLQ